MLLTTTIKKPIISHINTENYYNLKNWLLHDFNFNNKPYDINVAYYDTIFNIKNVLFNKLKNNNKNIYIDNLIEFNDIFHTNNYKTYLDCLLYLPFVNIYRCYINYNNLYTKINIIGYSSLYLNANDLIILEYNKNHYYFNDTNSKLLRLNYIVYDNILLYPYIKIIKYILYIYEILYIKYMFNTYYINKTYDLYLLSCISTHFTVINIISILDIIFGINNLFIYYLINEFNLYNYNIYVCLYYIIYNIINLKNKNYIKPYLYRDLLLYSLYFYATSYSTFILE